ncbi:hypothetical protein QN277_022333 [Acacia crassicarpa]|uniref:PGG domain-containing protein n=1 Tax=Acacia crassicarpa TaxID=499986 RepID=A0AAE1MKU7_9FABA|nr:hypothetical protein QN277_022333 [Acacia crassicarpa]
MITSSDSNKMRDLYEASLRGDVSILNSLVQKNPLILFKISRSDFTETPLHISALLGHVEFTKALLMHNPKLATEMDSCRSTALHLASAEGHVHIVKELLQVFDEVCLVRDEEGRIPLHYAAMRGRIEVVRELVEAKPESLSYRVNGETVFHLCVKYSHLETLQALVELELAVTSDLINLTSIDNAGNTVLQLAIMLKRPETVRYLLLIPKIREAAKLDQSEMSLTDNMENSKSFQLQVSFLKSCPRRNEKIPTENHPPSLSAIFTPPKKCDWLEEMRGNLSLVATVISTISFQALINPPGGFLIQGIVSEDKPLECLTFNDNSTACPGDAVSAISYPYYFHYYLKYNTVAFVSSLVVALLLVSGVPLKHKAVIWMLSIGMCITLTFLTLTYLNGLYLVTPNGGLFDSASDISKVSLWTWIGFLGLIALFITLRFLFWLWKNWMKTFKRQILPCT